MNTAEDGLPLPQRYWAILTLAIGMVVSVLDSSIANIALPTIARQIGATPSQSIWVINAYQLAVVVSLLPLASLGDIFGYRRIYAIGFAIFTAAALISALSYSLPMLAVGRALAGPRLGRDDERQHGARAVYLSAAAVGARHRDDRGRGVGVVGGGAERRRGDPRSRLLALAVRGQCAGRVGHFRIVVVAAAAHSPHRRTGLI